MSTMRRIVHWGVWSALAALISAGVVWSASPVKQTAPELTRRSTEVKNHRQIPWVNDRPAWDMERPATNVAQPGRPAIGLRASSASSPGIVLCAEDPYDFQHNDGTVRQVASLGDGAYVHFGYMWLSGIPDSINDPDRYVMFDAYSTSGGLVIGDCGATLPSGDADPTLNRAGYIGAEVNSGDCAHLAFHQRNNDNQPPASPGIYSSFVLNQGIPAFMLFADDEMPGSVDAEAIWPHMGIDRGGSATRTPGDDVYHVCSHVSGEIAPYTTELFYWRRVGDHPATWEGPVVLDRADGGSLSHHIATDPTDENVAVVYVSDESSPSQLMQVLYVESANNGADWITTGVPLFPTPVGPVVNGGRRYVTNYTDPDGPQAWFDCTGEYDSQGRLHVVWIQQETADEGNDCSILYWNDFSVTTLAVAQSVGWPNAGHSRARSLWLSSPQIGFGDGNTLCTDGPVNPGGAGTNSNLDYIYLTFDQFGGPASAEANDVSAKGYQNSDIYLAVSNNRGASWSKAVDLTNTQTPGCDGTVSGNECAAEVYPSINLLVNDTLHLFYYLDTDAGAAVFSQGSWTNGQAMYYRIPGGTDTQPLCPVLQARFAQLLSDSDPDCEYHTTLNPPGTVSEQLTIINYGNAPLTGGVAVTPPSATWLQVSTAGFSIPSGGAPDIRPVTMDAGDASITGEGLYSAQIEITHNDPDLTSPFPIPVDFFVFDNFYCPEYVALHTDCLWLEVSNIERIGNQNTGLSGLTRLGSDSSWSVYDGSLIIGMPPNPDTLVYRTVYGWGNGYPGFRALGNLVVDTSAYGTFTGDATASAVQTTSDSTLGINVEYVFPQDPDSCEFVLIKYRVTNNSESDMLNLAVGEAVDFDVMPGVDERALQTEQQNYGTIRSDFNLIYQRGADTSGHVVVGDNTAERWKAGMTQISCWPSPRAWIAPNDPWLYGTASGGFEEGYLYREMTKTGFEIFNAPMPQDMHSVLVFDNDLDLAPGESQSYTMGLVSSNTGTDETDLINTTKKAWRYAFGWQEFMDLDTIPDYGTPRSYPYRAVGSHEDGFAGGCCGCIVEKVSGSGEFTIVPGPDPCEGTIEFGGGQFCCDPWVATFRVSDLCHTYSDEFTMVIYLGYHSECWCLCNYQCDYDSDGFLTALDLGKLIDVLFAGEPDVQDNDCPSWRGDFDCDCFTTALDLSGLIDHLFTGAPPPCDPCVTGTCGPQCP